MNKLNVNFSVQLTAEPPCWTLNVTKQGEERHLECLDVLKLVSVPLFDLAVLPSGEEQMSFGNKLEEHDAEERKESRKSRQANLWLSIEKTAKKEKNRRRKQLSWGTANLQQRITEEITAETEADKQLV